MRWFTAILAFIVVFLICFVLGGWFIHPHVPPTPSEPITIFELRYWIDNWSGALLGLICGAISARQTLRHKKKPGKNT